MDLAEKIAHTIKVELNRSFFDIVSPSDCALGAIEEGAWESVLAAARAAISIVKSDDDWAPIETAPKDRRILITSPAKTIYAAHWVKNPISLDEAWLISQVGEEQHICRATHWRPLPPPPREACGE